MGRPFHPDVLAVGPEELNELLSARKVLQTRMGLGLSVFLVDRQIDYLIAKFLEVSNANPDHLIKVTYSYEEAAV